MKTFIIQRIIIIILGILVTVITAYFHNKYKKEITIKDNQIDSLNILISKYDKEIYLLTKQDPVLLKRIESIKNMTNEEINHIYNLSHDSIPWFFSEGQYINR